MELTMKTKFDYKGIRSEFPFLSRKVNQKPIIYLDSAASSQKPQNVIDQLVKTYSQSYSNIHRGLHTLSEEATNSYEEVRLKIARFINAYSKEEIIFTSGATMSINLIANSYGLSKLKPNDEIIITVAEHHANIIPWQMLCEKTGAKLIAVPVDKDGSFHISALKQRITKNTRIISVPHVSNVLGTVFPIKEISQIAHENKAICVVDGCQGVTHMPVDIQDLNCDFYVFSGHKLFGPTGIGILYGKEEWLNKLTPPVGGGGMIKEVHFDKTTYAELPEKFEAGTPNMAGAIGLAKAIEYINNVGYDNIKSHESELLGYALKQLKEIPELEIYGNPTHQASVISFNIKSIRPFDTGTILDQLGIAVRTGHHCNQPLMQKLGIPGTVRASFAFYNSFEEVDSLVAGIKKAITMFC